MITHPIPFEVKDNTGYRDQWLFTKVKDCRLLVSTSNEEGYSSIYHGSLVVVGFHHNESLSGRRLCLEDISRSGYLMFEIVVDKIEMQSVKYQQDGVGYFTFLGTVESLSGHSARRGNFKIELVSGTMKEHQKIFRVAQQISKARAPSFISF